MQKNSKAPKIVPPADKKMSNISAIPLAVFASRVSVNTSVNLTEAGSAADESEITVVGSITSSLLI
jgi:hypothetical protein